jgi:heme exporter protein D
MVEFFQMGGYAEYIWPSYGAVALVMIVLLAQSVRAARRAEREAEQLKALSPRRRRRSGGQ